MPNGTLTLKAARVNAETLNNWTSQEYADALNVSRQTVYNWENPEHKAEPTLKQIRDIVEFSKIELDWLKF